MGPTDAAGLKEIVTFYEKNFKQVNSPHKNSPTKKLDEEKNVVKSPAAPSITNGKAPVTNGKPADEESSDEEEKEEDDADEESSDEEDSDDEEEKAMEVSGEVVKPATAPSE